MEKINWLTVIVSVIISTITANLIAYRMLTKTISHLDKSTTKFINEVKDLTINKKLFKS